MGSRMAKCKGKGDGDSDRGDKEGGEMRIRIGGRKSSSAESVLWSEQDDLADDGRTWEGSDGSEWEGSERRTFSLPGSISFPSPISPVTLTVVRTDGH